MPPRMTDARDSLVEYILIITPLHRLGHAKTSVHARQQDSSGLSDEWIDIQGISAVYCIFPTADFSIGRSL